VTDFFADEKFLPTFLPIRHTVSQRIWKILGILNSVAEEKSKPKTFGPFYIPFWTTQNGGW